MKSELSLELNIKLKGGDIFNDIKNLYRKLGFEKKENDLQKKEESNKNYEKNPSYINAINIVNNYFNN